MKILLTVLIIAGLIMTAKAQKEIDYGYPSRSVTLRAEGKSFRMSYMDIPAGNDAPAVLLLHGKNFNGFYWKGVIDFLHNAGYRVIVPDQVGWGKSDRPDLHYSFHLLASNTKQLLDSLHIDQVSIIAHSMGGILGTRFALLYPSTVKKLVLENPIGLEDYKTFVPYQTIDSLYAKEARATYGSYLAYQKTYYPVWKEAYKPLVVAQAADLSRPDFKAVAFANALTYQMIFEQPVCYEFERLSVPCLLIIGTADRTIAGKDKLDDTSKEMHGQYQLLGKQTQQKIKNSRLAELPGVGHIPHIQAPDDFKNSVLGFLK